MNNILLIPLSVRLNATAQAVMRCGMLEVGEISFDDKAFLRAIPIMMYNIFLMLSILCYGPCVIIWMIVFSREKAGFAHAFSSLRYVLVTVFGVIFLKENILILRIVGILAVYIGIILVA